MDRRTDWRMMDRWMDGWMVRYQSNWMNEALKLNSFNLIFLYLKTYLGFLTSMNILVPNLTQRISGWCVRKMGCWRTAPGHPISHLQQGSMQSPDLSLDIWLTPQWAEVNEGMILWQFWCPDDYYIKSKLSNTFHLCLWPGGSWGPLVSIRLI